MKLVTILILMFSLAPLNLHAGHLHKIEVAGEQYEPKTLKAWPGDTIKFCNNGSYGRQPYSQNQYNRFGQRKAESFKMIKKGECVETTLSNPTPRWIKVTVRDAVNPKAKLVIQISPKS